MENRPKKLLGQVQDTIRIKHYSYQTEKTYLSLSLNALVTFIEAKSRNKLKSHYISRTYGVYNRFAALRLAS